MAERYNNTIIILISVLLLMIGVNSEENNNEPSAAPGGRNLKSSYSQSYYSNQWPFYNPLPPTVNQVEYGVEEMPITKPSLFRPSQRSSFIYQLVVACLLVPALILSQIGLISTTYVTSLAQTLVDNAQEETRRFFTDPMGRAIPFAPPQMLMPAMNPGVPPSKEP